MLTDAFDEAKWFDALRWLCDVKQGVRPLVVPILDEQGRELGELRPITVEHLRDEALLERFVVWRNQNRLGYLDQRPVTLAGVRRYVEDVVYNPTRLTLLAYVEGRPIARIGAVRIGPLEHESDGTVRGERGGGMQFMYRASLADMVLMFYAFNQRSMISRVLSTNDLARDSCKTLGYDMCPVVSVPVYRVQHPDGYTLETSGRPEELVAGVTLDTFRITREAFFATMAGRAGFSMLDSGIRSQLPNGPGEAP